MDKISKFIATGFYTGYLPGVPGTWGSLSFIAIWWIFVGCFGLSQFALLGIVVGIGVLSSANYIKSLPESASTREKNHDPRAVVIDEWAGMAVSLINVHYQNYLYIFVAFILFRLFDIAKPGPIRAVEKLPGAIGIMADDIIAGMVVTFIIQIFIL